MNKIVLIIMLFISNHLISQITIKEFVQKTEYKDWETEPSYSNAEEDCTLKKIIKEYAFQNLVILFK